MQEVNNQEERVVKVFGVGMFKTGTKSLGQALQELGYKTSWWCWYVTPEGYSWYPTDEEIDMHMRDIVEYVKEFDAFCDAPWMYAYKQLDREFPGSKFILTVRDYNDIADSDKRQWLKGGSPSENIPTAEKFISRAQQHEKSVLEYFKDRSDDLLVINICKGEGWEKLAPFLGKEHAPVGVFPHANKGEIV
jgi:hypothetical protein